MFLMLSRRKILHILEVNDPSDDELPPIVPTDAIAKPASAAAT